MILRRLTANLRAQNWTSVAIELAIVIVGVFIGIQAANWNQERLERNETRILLSQLKVELASFSEFLNEMEHYYRTTARFAAVANAGWRRDPSVSDKEFVIAAYQASQVIGVGNNSAVWAEIFGAGDLRNIEDVGVRTNLARVMTFDYRTVDLDSVSTPYRQEVRKVIPDEIQAVIRSKCGDRRAPNRLYFKLPETCDIDIPERAAAEAAAELRGHPELQAELRWHLAAVSNQLLNVGAFQQPLRALIDELEKS